MLSNNNYLYIIVILRKYLKVLKFDLYKKQFLNGVFLERTFLCSSDLSDLQ